MGKRNFLWVAVMLLMAGCQKEEAKENTVTPIPTQEETKENAITPIPTQEEIKVLSPTAGVTPELKEELDMEVVYDAVELKGEGVTQISVEEGKGVLLDLDLDGEDEKIYTSKDGIFINGICEAKPWGELASGVRHQKWERFWVVDIDRSDSYLNLVFAVNVDGEVMAWYDGALKMTDEYYSFTNCAFSTAEYRGDGSFVMKECGVPMLYQSTYKSLEYTWSVKEGVERVKQPVVVEEQVREVEGEDGQWRLISEVLLYEECRMDAKASKAEKGQKIYPLKIDFDDYGNYCWIFLQTEDGLQGWIYSEYIDRAWIINQEKDAWDVIEGYSTAG